MNKLISYISASKSTRPCILSMLVSTVLLVLILRTSAFPFCFDDAGAEFRISPQLLKSIALTESNMKQQAINRNSNGSTDYGLMQINSFWIKSYGLPQDALLNDACYNTKIGAWVLRQCIDRYGYNWEAVGCYNAVDKGKRSKYAWKVFKNLKKAEKEESAVSSISSEKSEDVTTDNALSIRVMETPELPTD